MHSGAIAFAEEAVAPLPVPKVVNDSPWGVWAASAVWPTLPFHPSPPKSIDDRESEKHFGLPSWLWVLVVLGLVSLAFLVFLDRRRRRVAEEREFNILR